MALLEIAAEYVLGILTENEEFKKFPKEFVGESVKWVKSWFLTPEDPKTTAKLEAVDKSPDYKKAVIDAKLEDLVENAVFMTELKAKLAQYEVEKRKTLNTIEDANLTVKGNFRQGTTGNASGSNADEVNSIKRTTIVVDGDFRQGDDVISR
jgi:hypothetical protein